MFDIIQIIKRQFATDYLHKGAGVVVKENDEKYIKKLEQFLDGSEHENMVDIYKKTAFKVIDYLEKSN